MLNRKVCTGCQHGWGFSIGNKTTISWYCAHSTGVMRVSSGNIPPKWCEKKMEHGVAKAMETTDAKL